MRKALVLTLMMVLGLVSAAHADTGVVTHNNFSFTIWSDLGDGSSVIFNSDSVQDKVTDILDQLGATNVTVTVLSPWNQMVRDPEVQVQFDSLRTPTTAAQDAPVAATWKNVSFRGEDDAYLVYTTLKNVKDHFEVRDYQATTPGMGPEYSYHVSLSTLVAQ
jgi:hypothetical protein